MLKDESGQVTGALSSARDITERKQAEEALIESEQKYKLLVENAEEAVYVIQDGVFRFANSMCGKVLDLPVTALMGLPMLDFVHPDDREKATRQHRRMLAGEQDAQRNDFRILTRNGEMRWAEVNSVAVNWEGKKATLNIATDITERKRAEQALRLSETFLDSVIEHSPHAMWISDDRGTLIRLNKACRELLHIADDDVVGKYNVLQDSIVSEQGYLPLVQRVFEQGETINFTMEYDSSRLKNLALRNPVSLVLDTTISPVLDVDGRVMHAIIQHIDITDQKRAEKALTQSEEKFRKAFYTSPDSVNINRLADGMYVSINPGFTRITGYTEEDIIGKTSIEYNIWANAEDRQRLVDGLRKDGEVTNLEACFRMKSGDIRYGLMSASMIDLDGVPHILSITRDITERKRAEEALRENEEKYRLLADNADDVIFVLDMNLNYTYISPSVRILRGYEPEEIFTQQSLETLTSDSRDLALKALSEIMELEKSGREKVPLSLTLPLEMRRKDGSTVWTEVKFSFIRDEDGQPVGILGVTRDISDRRRAEEERKRLQSQLVQAQKMESVGRLAGGWPTISTTCWG